MRRKKYEYGCVMSTDNYGSVVCKKITFKIVCRKETKNKHMAVICTLAWF